MNINKMNTVQNVTMYCIIFINFINMSTLVAVQMSIAINHTHGS